MATFTVNSPNSSATSYPQTISGMDTLIFNNTGIGESGTILEWTVPVTANYKIEARGAKGGGTNGGKGARMTGDFLLTSGEVIRILVGHAGRNHGDGTSANYSGAGGGGSFVVKKSGNIPLVVAGGGGGHSGNKAFDASTGINGVNGGSGGNAKGGIDGGGGGAATGGAAGTRTRDGGVGASCSYGPGGGGFYTNGGNNCSGSNGNSGGRSFLSGGIGGIGGAGNNISGSFGGGASAGHRGGGGGGWSGGGGGYDNSSGGGGGGGSYNAGVNQLNATGVGTTHGRVTIQLLDEPNSKPTMPTSFTMQPDANSIFLPGEVINLEWDASTDEEGDAIAYTLEFFNGSNWSVIESNLLGTSASCILPLSDTTSAQFRVKAVDDKNGSSDYQTSNQFTVRSQLLLIQDGESLKTYKNGTWETI